MGGFLWMVFFMLLFIAVVCFFWFDGIGKLHDYWFGRKSLAEKAEIFMKEDFSPKCARASFYIGNNYRHKMCQADWQKYCQERVGNILDKNSQEYAEAVAPIFNAIVVGEAGYYIRRGMEHPSFTRFLPGVNDRISLNYFVEPYEYVENKELAAKSLAEEARRQKESEERYERERPIREAYEAEMQAKQRCFECVNNKKCSPKTKSIPGACGGYRPR